MSTINENNITDVNDSTILENTPMVVIEQNGTTLAIPITGGGRGVEQVQADWAQTDDTAVDFIKNKPQIPRNVADLADGNQYAKTADIPTKVSQLQNDAGYAKNSSIPTKVSQLYNDSGYVTEDEIPNVEIADGVAAQEIITDDTSTAVNIINLARNTRYVYTQPITSVNISAVEDSNFESEIQFTTADVGISLNVPDTLRFIGSRYIAGFGYKYIINIKNNIAVVARYE